MTALEIKGMKIGEGLPKTIISLMDPTVDELSLIHISEPTRP